MVIDEVVDTAKAGEPDHYLAALLAPAEARPKLLAIAAFAAELARVPRRVTEPMMGEIRLQWWRDTVQQGTDLKSKASPLAAAIQQVVANGDSTTNIARLVAMTEARAFDLYSDPMADEVAFWGYLDKTSGALFALSLSVTAVDVPQALADHAGRAYGMTRLLADLPRRLAVGRNPFPMPWLEAAGLGGAIKAEKATERAGVGRLIDRVSAEIAQEDAFARRLATELSRAERVPLLPLATIPPYLAAIRRDGVSGRHVEEIHPLGRIMRIAWAHGVGL